MHQLARKMSSAEIDNSAIVYTKTDLYNFFMPVTVKRDWRSLKIQHRTLSWHCLWH